MGDARRQQGHGVGVGDTGPAAQSVCHGPRVDEHQRPLAMGVRRVGVIGHPRVQHLAHPRDCGVPGAEVRGRMGARHARNVQDGTTPQRDAGMVTEPVRFPTRIALVLRDDLQPWQVSNVSAFLASGIAAPELMGETYADADGAEYLPLLGQPIMVLQGDRQALGEVRRKAVDRELRVAVYDRGMFTTGDDASNRRVVAASTGDDLDLVGVAVHGAKNAVDRILKGIARHR